mgnify:CR=1 FL=1
MHTRATAKAPVPPLNQKEEGRPRTKEGQPGPLHPQVLAVDDCCRKPAGRSRDLQGDVQKGPSAATEGTRLAVQKRNDGINIESNARHLGKRAVRRAIQSEHK